MSDYSKFSLERLKGTIDILTNKLWEIKLDENPDLGKVDKISEELDQMDLALKERTEVGLVSPPIETKSGQSSAVPGYSGIHKELQNSFRFIMSKRLLKSLMDGHSDMNL